MEESLILETSGEKVNNRKLQWRKVQLTYPFRFFVSGILEGRARVSYSIAQDMDQLGEQLCEAAKSGADTNELRGLIESGADVSYFDGHGLTPLMHASKHGHAHVVKILLEAGAPWNALSPSNLSAGDFAMEAGHQEAFDTLLNAGKVLCLLVACFNVTPSSFVSVLPFSLFFT